jgi:hypothetical protein
MLYADRFFMLIELDAEKKTPEMLSLDSYDSQALPNLCIHDYVVRNW